MNRKVLSWVVAGLALVPRFLWAQDPQFVKFPTGPAAWSIEVKRLATSEGAEGSTPAPGREGVPKIVRIEVAQFDKLFRQVVIMSDGKERETWGLEGMKQTMTEDPNGSVFFTSESEPFDRSSFDWVKADTLVEAKAVKFGGRECLHYKTEKKVFWEDKLQGVLTLEAWIDVTTKMPVALQNNLEIATYNFLQPAPTGPLKVPERFVLPLEYKKRALGL